MADQEEYASADELDEELERAFEAPPRHVSGAEKSKKEQQSSIFTTNSSWGDGVTQHSGLQTKQKALGLDPSLSSVAYSLDDPPTSGRIDQSTGAGDIRLEKESAAQAQENKARGTLRSISKAAGSNTKDVTINAFSRQLARQSNDLGEGSFDLWTHGTSTSSLSGASAPTKPEITFQFPDWGVNFGKAGLDLPAGRSLLQDARLQIEGAAVQSGGWDAKEGNGSAITATEANGKGKGNPTELASSRSKGRLLRPEEDPSLPASFCVFHTLPEEVLLIIFKKLAAVKDVCSCILVCNKWEESLSGDEIWAGLLARQIPGRKFAAGGAKVEYKRGVMIRSVGYRFQFLRKGFEFLAAALDAWWDSNTSTEPVPPYDQPTVRRIVGKLTASNWALLYEGFAALFIARADKLAVELLASFATAQAPATHTPPSPLLTSFLPRPSTFAFPKKSSLRTPQNPSSSSPATPYSASDVSLSAADVSKRVATTLQQAQSSRNPQTVSGSFSDDLLGSLGRGKRRRGGFAPTVRLPTNQAVPLGELVERAESEPEGRGWGRGLRGLAEGGVNPDDVAEALAGGRELYGSDGGERGGIDGLDSPYNGRSFSNLNGTEALESRPKAGPAGAALWREVLRVWRRHRAFMLVVSEQCEALNIEVLRERARAHAVAATPTVFDQGALCFRGQILLRHRLRRPLQAGLAWLTLRAVSGDATDDEYELLKEIRHMRQEIDVRDDFTLTKATFTQAKFRRCFCNV